MGHGRAVLIGCMLTLALVWPALGPAPAAAQPADDEIVLIDETFNNPDAGEFRAYEREGTRTEYDRGAYVMEGFGEQFPGLISESILDVVADGTIAVDVRLRGPADGRFLYVGCRADDRGGIGYQLGLVPANGSVVLLTVDAAGGYLPLTDFVVHDAIHTGSRTNRLELSCRGSAITGRVNGADIVSVTDDQYQQGTFYVGAGIFSGTTGSVEGVFDNLLVTKVAPTDAPSRRDAREFDQLRAEAEELPSLFGPSAGELRSGDVDVVTDRIADVEVRDFYATATFVNPYDADEQRWSVGLGFRHTGEDEHLRLILRSTGRWYVSDGPTQPSASGLAEGMATGEGDENTIAVAVVDEAGYLALNGEFLATFDASARMDSGDVWVGSGFFTGDNITDDRTDFHDFEVWGLGEDAAPAEPEVGPSGDDDAGRPRGPAPAPPSTQGASVTCADFLTQEGAQYALDITRDEDVAEALDPDGDGIACDDLPSRGDGGDGEAGSAGDLPQPRDPRGGRDEPSEPDDGGLTDEDLAYLEAMYEQFDALSVSMTRLNQVLDDVNSGALGVEEGRAQLQDIFALWEQAPRDAETLDPPPTSAETHELFLEFVGLLAQAADDLGVWLSDGDDVRLDAGIDAFNQAVMVQEELEAILADAGIL